MDINIGDKVQMVDGAVDLLSGATAVAGMMYGSGGPYWATVTSIDDWNTGGLNGESNIVSKIRCTNDVGTVVWQVDASDISSHIIRANVEPETIEPSVDQVDTFTSYATSSTASESCATCVVIETMEQSYGLAKTGSYAPTYGSASWLSGTNTYSLTYNDYAQTATPSPTKIGSSFPNNPINTTLEAVFPGTEYDGKYYSDGWSIDNLGLGNGGKYLDIWAKRTAYSTAWSDDAKRRVMLNNDIENIQNSNEFPHATSDNVDSSGNNINSGNLATRYDYMSDPHSDQAKKFISLEDKLIIVRKAFGIPVHGSNSTARNMKLNYYNRFKTPDSNLLHNKHFTHVFFTRPDLNLLIGKNANSQVNSHVESSMLWKMKPQLFKLLTLHGDSVNDDNMFNMLLSNQITSFNLSDEELGLKKGGATWHKYSINYGIDYQGRNSGKFTCEFAETSDFSILQLMKLWMGYIDNVSRGAWSPSYNFDGSGVSTNINKSHVYSKTLDYASSVYVFKVASDGETILYWTKYYGTFPVTNGSSALSWSAENGPGPQPNLSIDFAYSFKRDLSPIALLEFNHCAKTASGNSTYLPSFDHNQARTSVSFVGCPFIEISNANSTSSDNSTGSVAKLKFRESPNISGRSKYKDYEIYSKFLSTSSSSSSYSTSTGNGDQGIVIFN